MALWGRCYKHWQTKFHTKTKTTILAIKLSLAQGDDCQARNDTCNYITKPGPNTKPQYTMLAAANNELTTTKALSKKWY